MDALDEHLSHLRALNRRTGTVYQRRLALERLERFAEMPLSELDGDTIARWCAQPQLGPDARASRVSHARGFYRWLVETGRRPDDPTLRLRRPRRDRRLPRPMADDHARTAMLHAPSPIREWLHLAAYAGLRACEIAPLRGEDAVLDSGARVLVIRESKGGDTSAVPISAVLLPVVEALPRRGWWWPAGPRSHTPHVSAGQVSKRTNRYLHELGIPETLHTLRHWYGTHVYRATGRDLRATQELMRHRSMASTVGYTWIDLGAAARALDALPELVHRPAEVRRLIGFRHQDLGVPGTGGVGE